MPQHNVTTSGFHLAKALVTPAGGGADETLANIAQAALANASTDAPGRVELATKEETASGTDAARAVTPAALAAQDFITSADVTYEALNDNGDVGAGASQLAAGNHEHTSATSAAAGFMSAADKAKLDGVEAGATADQTSAEIVAAVNTALGGTEWQHAGEGAGSSAWGSIIGTLSDQADLQNFLDSKQDASPMLTALGGIDATAGVVYQSAADTFAKRAIGTGASDVAAGNHRHDGVYIPTSRQVATQHSLTGGGNLSSDRALSLVNDQASPGVNMVYGTDAAGVRGWKSDPAGSGDSSSGLHTHLADDLPDRGEFYGKALGASLADTGGTVDINIPGLPQKAAVLGQFPRSRGVAS